MTSTIFNDFWDKWSPFIILGVIAIIVVTAIAFTPSVDDHLCGIGKRCLNIATLPTSPPEPTPQAPQKQETISVEKEAPYYGLTYWSELLTSVYYYPSYGNDEIARTHLKFNHREDDIWLCGDQRKSFEPGNWYKLTVTFEPNQPCSTNWKAK